MKYKFTSSVAATIGAEHENDREIFIMIDEDLEVTYMVSKELVPQEFCQYGLPVWVQHEDSKILFKFRKFEVTKK